MDRRLLTSQNWPIDGFGVFKVVKMFGQVWASLIWSVMTQVLEIIHNY